MPLNFIRRILALFKFFLYFFQRFLERLILFSLVTKSPTSVKYITDAGDIHSLAWIPDLKKLHKMRDSRHSVPASIITAGRSLLFAFILNTFISRPSKLSPIFSEVVFYMYSINVYYLEIVVSPISTKECFFSNAL